jgi:hypothetical protein
MEGLFWPVDLWNPIPNGNMGFPTNEINGGRSFLELDLKSISLINRRYTLKIFYFSRANIREVKCV